MSSEWAKQSVYFILHVDFWWFPAVLFHRKSNSDSLVSPIPSQSPTQEPQNLKSFQKYDTKSHLRRHSNMLPQRIHTDLRKRNVELPSTFLFLSKSIPLHTLENRKHTSLLEDIVQGV